MAKRPPSWRNLNEPFGRRVLGTVAVVILLPLILTSISVVGALSTPGNESFKAKWADWLRAHHAAFVVNHLESYYYSHHQPKKGGRPKRLNAVPTTNVPVDRRPTPIKVPQLPPPKNIPLLVQPALPHEGEWLPTFATRQGVPAMRVAQFRADSVYTSEITSAVWIDTSRLRVRLNPGATEPGGQWPEPPDIEGAALKTAVAAFNGGFRFQDAHGGFYLDGRTAVPLQQGAASIVIYKNGKVDVRAWEGGNPPPNVDGILQNLTLIVDNGQLNPSLQHGDTSAWGATLGAKIQVARSGVGVDKNGALIFVAGPALSVTTLAKSLQRAGAVRAMTLDLNPEWVTFNFFRHPNPQDPSQVVPSALYPEQSRPASRYLGPTQESRDFFTVSWPS